jgi:hypothetical protein
MSKALDKIGWIVELCLPWAGNDSQAVVWQMDVTQVTAIARLALGAKSSEDRLVDALKAKHVGEAMSKRASNGKDTST